jgi:inosose dehydratase
MPDSANIRFGCHSYTWHMSGEKYRGRINHLATVTADAQFGGLEPELFMLGEEYSDPRQVQEALVENGLELAGLAYIADWLHAEETADERVEADRCVDFLRNFPRSKFVLVPVPLSAHDGSALVARQSNALACINAVARRAREAGVVATVHPNSSPDSAFRTADDYEVLFGGLDPGVGFTPDVGHIAAGGMDPLETIERYRAWVDHVHFKDIRDDGGWAPTGEGRLDFPGMVSYLDETGYQGWVIFEDESDSAERDPDGATRRNGAYARDVLAPMLAGGRPSR